MAAGVGRFQVQNRISFSVGIVFPPSRNLNPFCVKRGVKLEDHSHIASTIEQGDFMVCNDHDSGYWHVPVAEDHWTFLGIHMVDEEGNIQYWVWKVLVLALRDAAHIYTRINRPIMAALRREGIRPSGGSSILMTSSTWQRPRWSA